VVREEKLEEGKIKECPTLLAEWASSHREEMKEIEQIAQETVASFDTIEIKEWVKTTLCHILVNQHQVKVVMNDDPEHNYLKCVGLNFRLKPKQTIEKVSRYLTNGRLRTMSSKNDPVSSLVNFKDKFYFETSGAGTNNILYIFINKKEETSIDASFYGILLFKRVAQMLEAEPTIRALLQGNRSRPSPKPAKKGKKTTLSSEPVYRLLSESELNEQMKRMPTSDKNRVDDVINTINKLTPGQKWWVQDAFQVLLEHTAQGKPGIILKPSGKLFKKNVVGWGVTYPDARPLATSIRSRLEGKKSGNKKREGDPKLIELFKFLEVSVARSDPFIGFFWKGNEESLKTGQIKASLIGMYFVLQLLRLFPSKDKWFEDKIHVSETPPIDNGNVTNITSSSSSSSTSSMTFPVTPSPSASDILPPGPTIKGRKAMENSSSSSSTSSSSLVSTSSSLMKSSSHLSSLPILPSPSSSSTSLVTPSKSVSAKGKTLRFRKKVPTSQDIILKFMKEPLSVKARENAKCFFHPITKEIYMSHLLGGLLLKYEPHNSPIRFRFFLASFFDKVEGEKEVDRNTVQGTVGAQQNIAMIPINFIISAYENNENTIKIHDKETKMKIFSDLIKALKEISTICSSKEAKEDQAISSAREDKSKNNSTFSTNNSSSSSTYSMLSSALQVNSMFSPLLPPTSSLSSSPTIVSSTNNNVSSGIGDSNQTSSFTIKQKNSSLNSPHSSSSSNAIAPLSLQFLAIPSLPSLSLPPPLSSSLSSNSIFASSPTPSSGNSGEEPSRNSEWSIDSFFV
jgi:hypothetical protein